MREPGVFSYCWAEQTSHGLHDVLKIPLLRLKVLGGQGIHLPAAVLELPVSCCPGGQGCSAVQRVAYVPVTALKVPMGQRLQIPGL